MADCFERCNEFSASLKCGRVLDKLRKYESFKKNCSMESAVVWRYCAHGDFLNFVLGMWVVLT
jgi:hypothetical protein